MRYMFLIYSRETERTLGSIDELARLRRAHWAVLDETRRRGILCGAEPLQPTATATTIRIVDGKRAIHDGPFAETKEQLGGYYIIDCKDLDEAIYWAGRIPTACKGGEGCVEIRPVAALPARDGPEKAGEG